MFRERKGLPDAQVWIEWQCGACSCNLCVFQANFASCALFFQEDSLNLSAGLQAIVKRVFLERKICDLYPLPAALCFPCLPKPLAKGNVVGRRGRGHVALVACGGAGDIVGELEAPHQLRKLGLGRTCLFNRNSNRDRGKLTRVGSGGVAEHTAAPDCRVAVARAVHACTLACRVAVAVRDAFLADGSALASRLA